MKKTFSIVLFSTLLGYYSCGDNSNPANNESSHNGGNTTEQNGSEQNSSQNEGSTNNTINNTGTGADTTMHGGHSGAR